MKKMLNATVRVIWKAPSKGNPMGVWFDTTLQLDRGDAEKLSVYLEEDATDPTAGEFEDAAQYIREEGPQFMMERSATCREMAEAGELPEMCILMDLEIVSA